MLAPLRQESKKRCFTTGPTLRGRRQSFFFFREHEHLERNHQGQLHAGHLRPVTATCLAGVVAEFHRAAQPLVPSLAQRPTGLTKACIRGLERYFCDDQHWSAGPRLFIDDRQIWVFMPLTVSGVHSPSWNRLALGIEMLDEYTTDAFDTGRGAKVQANAVAAIAILSAVLGLDSVTMRLHKENPLTTHKGCPGEHMVKDRTINQVPSLL